MSTVMAEQIRHLQERLRAAEEAARTWQASARELEAGLVASEDIRRKLDAALEALRSSDAPDP
jgi:hypothetical protein